MQELPTGITREAGRASYLVTARVRPFPVARKRFALGTAVGLMLAWRKSEIDRMSGARAELEAEAEATADPIAPAPRTVKAPGGTLAADVETYIADKMRPGMHTDTSRQFRRWLRKLAATELGRYPRQAIRGAQLATVLERWARVGIPQSPDDAPINPASKKRRKMHPPTPLGNDTVNKIRTCWIVFYATMNAGTKLANPARDVPRREPTPPQARGIDYADAVAIVDQVGAHPGTRTAARLALMIALGLRPCEIMTIAPKDWNKRDGTIFIHTAKRGRNRSLDLSARATAALETLERLPGGFGKFATGPLGVMFHAAVAKAGLAHLEPIRPYDLRHTFATEAYRLTGDIKAVSDAIGHRTLAQTDRYTEAAVAKQVKGVCAAIAKIEPGAPKVRKARGRLHAV